VGIDFNCCAHACALGGVWWRRTWGSGGNDIETVALSEWALGVVGVFNVAVLLIWVGPKSLVPNIFY
jgi:hypothetical protein